MEVRGMKTCLGALAVAALLAAGCAGVNTGTKLNGMGLTADSSAPIVHLNASSWGIYLLPIFPLLTGDTTSTAGGMAVGFDSCRVEPVVDMITRAAKEKGAGKLTDLQSGCTSIWIPPFFWYKSVEASGNAVK